MKNNLKTIGFFGDSFCADNHKNSWCNILSEKLGCTIINFGKPGRSIWTAIFDFLKVKDQALPSYSVFCWTDPYRLYHKEMMASHNCEVTNKNKNIVEAARQYKLYLADQEKEHLEYEYILKHFDQNILKVLEKQTKILQTWSIKPFELANIEYNMSLTAGIFYDISLYQFSNYTFLGAEHEKNNHLLNHMTDDKNKELAELFFKKLN